jgi:hypothetical protein
MYYLWLAIIVVLIVVALLVWALIASNNPAVITPDVASGDNFLEGIDCTDDVAGKCAGTGLQSMADQGAAGRIPAGNQNIPTRLAQLGEPCQTASDCVDEGNGIACCRNRCTQKVRDWAGMLTCPQDCQAAPQAAAGTCDTKWSWPRLAGEPCALDADCAGWTFFGEIVCTANRCSTTRLREAL